MADVGSRGGGGVGQGDRSSLRATWPPVVCHHVGPACRVQVDVGEGARAGAPVVRILEEHRPLLQTQQVRFQSDAAIASCVCIYVYITIYVRPLVSYVHTSFRFPHRTPRGTQCITPLTFYVAQHPLYLFVQTSNNRTSCILHPILHTRFPKPNPPKTPNSEPRFSTPPANIPSRPTHSPQPPQPPLSAPQSP